MGGLVLQVSPWLAVLGSLALPLTFVASLYLWTLVGYEGKDRDEPGTIRRRFASALLTCACSAGLIYGLSQPAESGDVGFTLLELLGVQSDGVVSASVACLKLTALLFVGPLVQHLAGVASGMTPFVCRPPCLWVALRNYVMAPFAEEFVFRACVVRLWVAASLPRAAIVFCTSFGFAMAHTHHFIEHVRRLKNKRKALMQVLFQVFYTSLFGMYSNFLLLRTGSTVAVILTHSFCNHQGFPDLGFLVQGQHPLHQHRVWLGALYVIGVIGFCWRIGSATAGFQSPFASPGSGATMGGTGSGA